MNCFLRTLVIFHIISHVYPYDHTWWKHALIYQIYPRSFKDTNNDGIGDLKGIISELDFLKNTGFDALWLSPIYKSPQVDQGYDISDYRSIDESYGSMDDFDELIQKSKELGLKIVMDFVPNHTSNKHVWFEKSENGDPEFSDFYVWRKGREGGRYPPNNWISVFGGPAWTYSDKRQQYYLHQFTKEQPDLNLRNPKVIEEMKNILKFWLDKGVSGFRIDAVNHLIEDDQLRDEPLKKGRKKAESYQDVNHMYTIDQDETFGIIYDWRNFIDEYNQEHFLQDSRVLMTEANTDICTTMKYYGNHTHKGSHFTFNFYFITDVKRHSMAKDIKRVVDMWMNSMPPEYVPNCTEKLL